MVPGVENLQGEGRAGILKKRLEASIHQEIACNQMPSSLSGSGIRVQGGQALRLRDPGQVRVP